MQEKEDVLKVLQKKRTSKKPMIFIIIGIIAIVLIALVVLSVIYFSGKNIPQQNLTNNNSGVTETPNNNLPVPENNVTEVNDSLQPTKNTSSIPPPFSGGSGGGSQGCRPNCAGKQCGDNGCEGSCGTCDFGYECNSTFGCSLIPCINDSGCSSFGGFCELNVPYNCTLNLSDGCFDRVNGNGCESGYYCSGGSCLENPPYILNESWAFITVSDTYGGLEDGLKGSLVSAFTDNPDLKFIVSTGDFENNTKIDNNIQTSLKKYFPNQSVVPWFEALGNHNIEDVNDLRFIQDIIGGRLKTQLLGATNFRDGPYNDNYNWTGKNFTYSFDYKNAHFIIMNEYYGNTLNPNPRACVWNDNYEWLKQDLEQNTKPLIFVFEHEPAFPTKKGDHCGDSLEDPSCPNNSVTWRQVPKPMRDKYWQLFNDYKVTAHFVGHTHFFSARQIYNYSDFNLTTCDDDWNCYCNEEYKLPGITDGETIFPGKVLEYNNGITRNNGPVNIIRINGTEVIFSYYWRNSTSGILVPMLVFRYDFSNILERTIYVDNSLPENCVNYNVNNRTCGTGDKRAYNRLVNATAVAVAGDTVFIRAGTYNEIFKPINSGTPQNAITYKNYNNESVIITGTAYDARAASCPEEPNLYYGPIWIEYINYTIVDGLNFSNPEGFGRIVRSNHNTFKNCNFDGINPGWIIGLNLFESKNNRFENNKFEGAADNFRVIHSDSNIIQGNNFHNASHVLLTLKCSSYNIIKDNYFYNEIQKAMEIFDCEQPTMEDHYNIYCQSISILNSTKHNIIENNEFAYTAKDKLIEGYPEGPYNGIQYAGQEGIMRNNVFYDNKGGGLALTRYSQEAEYDNKNRVYNNVFYKNRFAGIQISGGTNFYDNILKNNILYKNDFVNWDNVYNLWGWQNASGKPFQIWVKTSSSGYIFDKNNILNNTAGDNHIIAHADDYESGPPANRSLAWWQQTHASNFINNIEANPLFVNESTHDFHLQSDSPMIDAGEFLTNTTSAGSGTVMQVSDAEYFYDGYGIAGEQGDLIQLDGQTTTARILSINYATNTITLDSSLTWANGQGVSLAYSGSKPDIGAYESTESSLPSGSLILSVFSQIWDWIKGIITGETIKAITGYFIFKLS